MPCMPCVQRTSKAPRRLRARGHLGQGEPENEDEFNLIVQRNPRQHDVLTQSFGQTIRETKRGKAPLGIAHGPGAGK